MKTHHLPSRLRLLPWALLALPAVVPPKLAAQVTPCFENQTAPPPAGSSNEYHLDWLADADQLDDDWQFGMTRIVVNRDTVPRRVTWKRARIDVAALGPGEFARHCSQGRGFRPNDDASIEIFFSGVEIPAEVFEIDDEQGEIREVDVVRRSDGRLDLVTSFAIGEAADSLGRLGLEVTASLTFADGSYLITYHIHNNGQEPLYVRLPDLPRSVMADFEHSLSPINPGAVAPIPMRSQLLPHTTWISAEIGSTPEQVDARVEVRGLLP